MENLSLIAAIGPNYELGINNQLIWRLKEDLKFYRQITMNQNIIMGRKTLESMPKKALENRNPIILTTNKNISPNNYLTFHQLNYLLDYIKEINEKFIVVGGESIYKQFLPFVEEMYLTHIETNHTYQADTYFPRFPLQEWTKEILQVGIEDNINYQICSYKKILEKKK